MGSITEGGAFIGFEERFSDSPLVEKIWCSRSERAGEFISVAQCHFEIVVTRRRGRTFLTLRGPETKATTAECPADGEWLGIRFQLGTFMPEITPGLLRDRNDVTLPDSSSRSFWLKGSVWEYPTFENAEVFVRRLVQKGVIAADSIVDTALRGHAQPFSLRAEQRHFLRATGLTRSAVRQIERARQAASLLRQGLSIADTVHEAGYFDQAHLTRSLKYRIGQTPTEVIRGDRQLSFLYKTNSAW